MADETETPRVRAGFTLPKGYIDEVGRVHRSGVLRLPTQKDRTLVMQQAGEVDNPAYLETLMLMRALESLGEVDLNDASRQEVVESLFLTDITYLNRVFRHIAWGGPHPDVEVECPECSHRWAPDNPTISTTAPEGAG